MQVQKKQALQKKYIPCILSSQMVNLCSFNYPTYEMYNQRETTLFGFPIINLPRNNF